MAEYINRQAVLDAIPHAEKDEKISLFGAVADATMLVSDIPAADVAPVVHGKWKVTGTFEVADYNYTVVEQRCSACGHCSIRFKNKAESNYCPKCGAKMDEEETHDKN